MVFRSRESSTCPTPRASAASSIPHEQTSGHKRVGTGLCQLRRIDASTWGRTASPRRINRLPRPRSLRIRRAIFVDPAIHERIVRSPQQPFSNFDIRRVAVAVGNTDRNTCPIGQEEHQAAESLTMAVNYLVRPVLLTTLEKQARSSRFSMLRTLHDSSAQRPRFVVIGARLAV